MKSGGERLRYFLELEVAVCMGETDRKVSLWILRGTLGPRSPRGELGVGGAAV